MKRFKYITLSIFLVGLFLSYTCADNKSIMASSTKSAPSKKVEETPTPTEDPEPTADPTPTAEPEPTEPSLEYCYSKGLAWQPRGIESGPAKCVGKFVDWCCNRETILARFPAQKDAIAATWDNPAKQFSQLKIYACSVVDGYSESGHVQKYDVHFSGIIDSTVEYRVIHLDNISLELDSVKGTDNCPAPITTSEGLYGSATSTPTPTATP